jgi:intracellular multiplication protein IcmV
MSIKSIFKKIFTSNVSLAKQALNVKENKENILFIKDSIKALSPKEQIKNSKNETFEDAMARLNVTEKDLENNYKNFSRITYISIFLTILLFILANYFLFFEHIIIKALSTIVVMFLSLTYSFKFSFRAFQIKHRELCDVKKWWESSSEWLPQLSLKKKIIEKTEKKIIKELKNVRAK